MMDPRDSDFRVCLASLDDLVSINEEARRRGWSARWSSADPLRERFKEGTFAIVCPYSKNSGDPASYRCYVWLYGSAAAFVGLIDVSLSALLQLHEIADVVEYRKAVQVLIGGYPLGALE